MKQKDILAITISIFVLTVLWVIFTIYHNFTTSTIEDPLTIQIIPIPGTFDTKTLDDLKKRNQITPNYNVAFTQTNTSGASVSPTPTPENSSSVSASLNENPQSTQSSELVNPGGGL